MNKGTKLFSTLIIDDNPGDIKRIKELLKESRQAEFRTDNAKNLNKGLIKLHAPMDKMKRGKLNACTQQATK